MKYFTFIGLFHSLKIKLGKLVFRFSVIHAIIIMIIRQNLLSHSESGTRENLWKRWSKVSVPL